MVKVHGSNGYRMGCRCEFCRDGERARRADYLARKRDAALDGPQNALTATGGIPLPRPADTVTAIGEAPGALERLCREAVEALDGSGAAAELLAAQALAAARVIDDAISAGKPHLIGPANRMLNDSLDRLRALAAKQRTSRPDDGEFDVDAFVAGLTKLCDPKLA